MRLRFAALARALAAACVLTGCGGGSQPTSPACTALADPPLLVYPASGSTRVPDGSLVLLVAYRGNPSVIWGNLAFIPSDGSQAFFGGPYRLQTSGYYGVNSPGLFPNTSYTVTVTTRSGCQTDALGTFSTL